VRVYLAGSHNGGVCFVGYQAFGRIDTTTATATATTATTGAH